MITRLLRGRSGVKWLLTLFVSGAVSVAVDAANSPFDTETKIVAADASEKQAFGGSVAIDGETAALGSGFNIGRGAVYIYSLIGSNWVATQKLTCPVANPYDTFGYFLDLKNGLLAVTQASPFPALNLSGQVYLYRQIGANWVLEAMLTNATPTAVVGPVVISQRTVVVGDAGDSSAKYVAGAVNIYQQEGTNWVFKAKVVSKTPRIAAGFGGAVAIAENTMLVGAPSDQTNVTGAAYVFVRRGTNWVQQQKLVPEGLVTGAHFGAGVVLQGNVAVISAPGQIVNGEAGAVYIYVRRGTHWTLLQRLTPPRDESNLALRFGTSLSIHNGTMLVGVPGEVLPNEMIAGAVHVYRWNRAKWVFSQKLMPSDPSMMTGFGVSADLGSSGALVGAMLDSHAAPNAGAAYIYTQKKPEVSGANLLLPFVLPTPEGR
jgi:hypothetical protein